ncbi:16S rRNA (guanine(527)-N(7))-methyltransferase RsmG [Fertoebacter nigrum]|uniref:Ribosomal RNA small subunit methyltransferase G n=1 Tax=Fertoeibacter niger TaxID=2656921 RepID=A0A8X8KNT5_9RHOB|nr:16S rRNA (guanine(527)-N(7))-methyltransferase RsmG [Fertoeibacter niger]NUB45350.1 16S rRNA (guanine(527)-N(7))-methyltransferase RsmG [Fertoeibacter niger]
MTLHNDPLAALGVSRETIQRLEALVALMGKWNPAINLVSKSTLADAWSRHILDSAQIYRLAPPGPLHWADLGSGGGFPGLVVAVLGAELQPGSRFTLVDSDQRKATFLRQSCQTLGLKAQVLAERIDAIAPLNADVLSARALAPLTLLCGFAQRHLSARGTALFMKGASHASELAEARGQWAFEVDIHPSVTEAGAVILQLKGLPHG